MKWNNEWTDTKNINNDTQFVFYDVLTAEVVNALVNNEGYLNNKITSEVNTITNQINDINTALAGKQPTLTFDSTPRYNSNNPVTSHGIKTAIENVSIEGDHLFLRGTTSTNISSIGLYVVHFHTNSSDVGLTSFLMISDLNRDSVAYVHESNFTVRYNSNTKQIIVTTSIFATTVIIYGVYKLASIV